MFNAASAVDVLRAVEVVEATSLLNAEEKDEVIRHLTASLTSHGPNSAPAVIKAALERKLGIVRVKRPTEAPSRETERVEEQAEVVEGDRGAATEASGGPTEGGKEQAEDAGGVHPTSEPSAPKARPAKKAKKAK